MSDIPYEIQVECNKDDNRKKAYKVECRLAIVELRSQEQSGALMVLMDDEELELRELQTGCYGVVYLYFMKLVYELQWKLLILSSSNVLIKIDMSMSYSYFLL